MVGGANGIGTDMASRLLASLGEGVVIMALPRSNMLPFMGELGTVGCGAQIKADASWRTGVCCINIAVFEMGPWTGIARREGGRCGS